MTMAALQLRVALLWTCCVTWAQIAPTVGHGGGTYRVGRSTGRDGLGAQGRSAGGWLAACGTEPRLGAMQA